MLNPSPCLGRELLAGFVKLSRRYQRRRLLRIGLALPGIPSWHLMWSRSRVGDFILNTLNASVNNVAVVQTPSDEDWLRRNARKFNVSLLESQVARFYGLRSWVRFVGQFDLFISWRIHGAMAALAAGVPTVVVPTDYRMLEMVQTMKLPHLAQPHWEFESNHVRMKDMVARRRRSMFLNVPFDAAAFDARRAQVAWVYAKALAFYGLPASGSLKQIRKGCPLGYAALRN